MGPYYRPHYDSTTVVPYKVRPPLPREEGKRMNQHDELIKILYVQTINTIFNSVKRLSLSKGECTLVKEKFLPIILSPLISENPCDVYYRY